MSHLFKRVSLFQTSLIFLNESHFLKRVPFFQTSLIFSNESHSFLKRVPFFETGVIFWNETLFGSKRVSSYFQTSLMLSNESQVFKRVSFLNRVPFETSIVYESYRDDFYRVLLAWFTRNLEWSNNTSYWRFITYERTIYATSFPGSLSLSQRAVRWELLGTRLLFMVFHRMEYPISLQSTSCFRYAKYLLHCEIHQSKSWTIKNIQ